MMDLFGPLTSKMFCMENCLARFKIQLSSRMFTLILKSTL